MFEFIEVLRNQLLEAEGPQTEQPFLWFLKTRFLVFKNPLTFVSEEQMMIN
jgi:hypothetical protein